ncbi:MAG: LamG domain-containing protein, partial [Planctomycetes bacterium]|nr:LamG domain-containing protein [Planctomycetota bacterium]
VFIGSDPGTLSSAATVNESSLDTQALDLQLGQTYHWRVDEINDVMDPSTWEGTVWSFTTADTIVIDDMESYADAEFLEIWATWVDGFDDPANGSLVGGVAGIPETDIVHGGNQSLPMDYDNGAAAQSEATRTFDAPMDWTRHGVAALVLFFQGSSNNTGGALYVKINDAKIAYDGDPADLMSFGWSKWYIPLSAVTGTDLSRVTALTIGVDGGGAGVVYIDDIVLTGAARDLVNPVDPGTAGLLAHYPLDGDYQDASGNGLHGSAVGNPVFENDPARGQVLSLNGIDAAVDLGASDVFNFPGSFSLSVWANITEFNSNWGHALLGKRGESGVGWQLRRHSGNPNLTFTTRGTDGPDDPRGNIDITTAFGQWVHVAAVYDMEAGRRTVYVNGSVDVAIDDGGTVANATQNTYIGARSNSGNTGPEAFFSGLLDDVRIYGRALSLEEVASLAGRTVPFDRP